MKSEIKRKRIQLGLPQYPDELEEKITEIIRETIYIFEKFKDPRKKEIAELKCIKAILDILHEEKLDTALNLVDVTIPQQYGR